MSKPEASAMPHFVKAVLIVLAGSIFLACGATAAAANLGRSYFFANRDACAASGRFTAEDCAAAFANARAQLRDRAPRFGSSEECRLKFRLCDVARPRTPVEEAMSYAPEEEVAYTPTALGVEIVVSANGVESAPTLAVETSARVFPYISISRPYRAEQRQVEAQQDAQNVAILPADHFEPFSRRRPFSTVASFTASALGAIDVATREAGRPESVDERRRRLRSAPLIE
jgi:Protein of unknown function (DUF1190)